MYNNGNGRDSRATEALLGEDAGLRVAQFYKDLADKDLLSWTGKVEDWGGSDNIFINEKAMYHMTSTGDINVISEGAKGKFDLKRWYASNCNRLLKEMEQSLAVVQFG